MIKTNNSLINTIIMNTNEDMPKKLNFIFESIQKIYYLNGNMDFVSSDVNIFKQTHLEPSYYVKLKNGWEFNVCQGGVYKTNFSQIVNGNLKENHDSEVSNINYIYLFLKKFNRKFVINNILKKVN